MSTQRPILIKHKKITFLKINVFDVQTKSASKRQPLIWSQRPHMSSQHNINKIASHIDISSHIIITSKQHGSPTSHVRRYRSTYNNLYLFKLFLEHQNEWNLYIKISNKIWKNDLYFESVIDGSKSKNECEVFAYK